MDSEQIKKSRDIFEKIAMLEDQIERIDVDMSSSTCLSHYQISINKGLDMEFQLLDRMRELIKNFIDILNKELEDL